MAEMQGDAKIRGDKIERPLNVLRRGACADYERPDAKMGDAPMTAFRATTAYYRIFTRKREGRS